MKLGVLFGALFACGVRATQDSIRLFDDLIFDYNPNGRPSNGPLEPTVVHVRLSLSQIIEMDEVSQVISCAVWLRQTWLDKRLAWDPAEYGQVAVLHVPAEILWVPDIVLYNAESTNNITISTKATIHHTGHVVWQPPAVFKSTCQLDVTWFPFDEQHCSLKFGSWSFPEDLLDLQFIDNSGFAEATNRTHPNISVDGVDLSDYYPSVEWDVMQFELCLRRKPFFYMINLIIPNVFMAFLTPLVFYLPCKSDEKVQLAISILVSVAFYFLLLTEIIPASGTTLPLISKYLLFTMLVVSFSSACTVLVLDIYYRKPTTHSMSNFYRSVLLKWLPGLLGIKRDRLPENKSKNSNLHAMMANIGSAGRRRRGTMTALSKQLCRDLSRAPYDERLRSLYYSPTILKCLENIGFISQLIRKKRCDHEVEEDWKYAAAVLDRFFLWASTAVTLVGTVWVFAQTPLLYDSRQPLPVSANVVALDELVRSRFRQEINT